jgi:hypothetical protein
MAVYNEILAGRYNRFLMKFLSMKGPSPAPALSSEIAATWALFHGVENRVLEGWQRYALSINLAAGGVGNFGKWRLRNPTKNIVAVIEKIVISNNGAAAGPFLVAIAGAITSDLGTLQTMSNSQLDLRGQAAPNLIGSFENNTATSLSGTPTFQNTLAVNTTYDAIYFEEQELTLANGNVGGAALHIQNQTANAPMLATIIWRERILEDSEQTFA